MTNFDLNRLRQNYFSVKVLHTAIKLFKTSNTRKGNFAIRYQNYFIDRVLRTLKEVLEQEKQNKQLVYTYSSIKGLKFGYETLLSNGIKPWEVEANQMSENLYQTAYNAIGDFIYPTIKQEGKLLAARLQHLLDKDKNELRKLAYKLDEKLLNEDIWLSLYAIQFGLNNKRLTEEEMKLIQKLSIDLIALLSLQEAYAIINSKDLNTRLHIENIINILQKGFGTVDQLTLLFNEAYKWARVYNYRVSDNKYKDLLWLTSIFGLKLPVEEDFVFTNEVDWSEKSKETELIEVKDTEETSEVENEELKKEAVEESDDEDLDFGDNAENALPETTATN